MQARDHERRKRAFSPFHHSLTLTGCTDDNFLPMPDAEEMLPTFPTANGIMRLPGNQGRCLRCKRIFSQLSNAKTHYVRMHVKTLNGSCDACDRTFKSQESLLKHLKTEHGLTKADLKASGDIIKMEKD